MCLDIDTGKKRSRLFVERQETKRIKRKECKRKINNSTKKKAKKKVLRLKRKTARTSSSGKKKVRYSSSVSVAQDNSKATDRQYPSPRKKRRGGV